MTGSGTLSAVFANESANVVLAGPTSGGAATPTWRALVAADIPAISLTTGVTGTLPTANGGLGGNFGASTGALSVASGTVTAGTLGVANGGTGAATLAAHGVLIGEGTSAVTSLATATPNLCLVSVAAADPAWGSCASGSGTVAGPASSTNNALALWNGTGGTIIKDSTATYTPGTLTIPQTTAASAATLVLDDSAVSGGFSAKFELINSVRDWVFLGGGAGSGLDATGEFAIFERVATRFWFSIGSAGGLKLWPPAGLDPADLGAGTINAPLLNTSGYYFGSVQTGLNYPAVASYTGTQPSTTPIPCTVFPCNTGGGNSLLGLMEGNSNLIGSIVPPLIIDAATDHSGYQGASGANFNTNNGTARHVATLDSNWQLNANTIRIFSVNDQVAPKGTGPYVAWQVAGWSNGNTANMQITSALGATATYTCTVSGSGASWTCGSGHTSATAAASIADYMCGKLNTAADAVGNGIYADAPPGTLLTGTAPIPSGYTGCVLLATYSSIPWTITAPGSGGAQFSAIGPVNTQLLDRPIGIEMYREPPRGSSRTPLDGDFVAGINWLAPLSASPVGGFILGEINVLTGHPSAPNVSSYMNFHTTCDANVSADGCLQMVIGGAPGGVSVSGFSTLNYNSHLGNEFEVWATGGHGGNVLSITGDVDFTSSMTILAETNTASALRNIEISGNNVFLQATSAGTGHCTWNGSGTSLTCSSDERIKKDIVGLSGITELAKLEAITPIQYHSRTGNTTAGHLGFTAQDVRKQYPELVTVSDFKNDMTPDGQLTLEYTGLIAPLVAAIQELHKEVQALQAKIK